VLAIDRHAWTNRWRFVHPGEKVGFVVGLMALNAIFPPLAVAPLVFLLAWGATVFGAGVPGRAFWLVLAVPAGFLIAGLPVLALSLSFDGTTPVLAWSPDGLRLAALVSLRSLAAVSCLAFLILTTPVPALLWLAQRLGLPQPLLELAYLMHRLVFVVLERALAAHQAQAARLGQRTLGTSIRSLGLLFGGLFLRSLERGRRLERGLAARGYRGEFHFINLNRQATLSVKNLFLVALSLAAVAGLALPLSALVSP